MSTITPPSPISPSISHAYTPGSHRRSHPNLQSLTHLSLAPLTPKYPIDPADYDAYFDPVTSELHTSNSLRSLSTVAGLPSPGGILGTGAHAHGYGHRHGHGQGHSGSRVGSRTGSRVGSRASSRTRTKAGENVGVGAASGIVGGTTNLDVAGSGLKRKAKSSIGITSTNPALSLSSSSSIYAHHALHSGSSHHHHLHPHYSDLPSGALTSEGFGHKSSNSNGNSLSSSKSVSRLHIPPSSSSSWIIQTGLMLTESSRETKGQSWLSKRDSSTSLASPIDERRPPRSLSRATPSVSRRNSNKRNSRRSLAMTPATATAATSVAQTPSLLHHDYERDVQPQWDDAHTQAEIAAIVESELAEEFADEDGEFDDGDPYGVLDFDGQFDSEDEEDVRREISSYQLGSWMDGIVDVFLRLEDFPDGADVSRRSGRGQSDGDHGAGESVVDLEAGKGSAGVGVDVGEESGHGGSARDSSLKTGDTANDATDTDVEPPPERPTGLWDDVTWFGRLLVRTVRS